MEENIDFDFNKILTEFRNGKKLIGKGSLLTFFFIKLSSAIQICTNMHSENAPQQQLKVA